MQHKAVLRSILIIICLATYMLISSGCGLLVAGAAAGAYLHGRNIEKSEGSK